MAQTARVLAAEQPARPESVADCTEPVCPCPRAGCAISRLADEQRSPDGRAVAALTLLAHAAGVVRAHLERGVLAADRLSWTGWQTLATVEAFGRIETRDLADQVAVSKSALSGLLDKLSQRGLLVRSPFPGDTRRVLVALTPAGTELVTRTHAAVAQAQGDLVDELSESEMTALSDATRKLLARVQSLR